MSLDKKGFTAELERQRTKHHDELAKLTAELEQAQAENTKLQREHEERVKAVERKWNEGCAHFQAERDAYRGELNRARGEIATLKAQLDRQVCRVSNLMYPGPWPAMTNADERAMSANVNMNANANALLMPDGAIQPAATTNIVAGESFADVNGAQNVLDNPRMVVPKDETLEAHNVSASAGSHAPPRGDNHMDVDDDSTTRKPPRASTAKRKSKQQPKSECDNEIKFVEAKIASRRILTGPSPSAQRPVRLKKPTERAAKIEHVEPRLSNRMVVLIPKTKQTTSPPLAANNAPGPLTYTPTDAAAQLDPPNREFTIHLSPEFVAQCLQGSTPFKILPTPFATAVPRRFLRETYGGSDQRFFQFVTANRDPSRAASTSLPWSSSVAQIPPRSSHPKGRPIVFPGPDYNQHMPKEPGQPGLIFDSSQEMTRYGPWSLFCKDPVSKTAVWTYLGEYECQLTTPVGGDEFRRQPHSVKVAWASVNLIRAKSGTGWAEICARIAVRKAQAFGSKVLSKSEADAAVKKLRKEGKTLPLSITDIIDALDRGDEGILLVKMQCVGYDHVFANDIAAKYAVWDGTAKFKAPKTLKRKGESLAKPSVGNNKLIKKAESDDDDDNVDVDGKDELREKRERDDKGDSDGPAAVPSAIALIRRSGTECVSLEGNGLGNGGWWDGKMDEDGLYGDAAV